MTPLLRSRQIKNLEKEEFLEKSHRSAATLISAYPFGLSRLLLHPYFVLTLITSHFVPKLHPNYPYNGTYSIVILLFSDCFFQHLSNINLSIAV